MTALLAITRGLPGSGKTTLAHAWVADDRQNRVRVNRDDLRAMIYDGVHENGITEGRIIVARNALIRAYLARNLNVICDDTNLPPRTMNELRSIATACGAQFELNDLTHLPLEVCLARNAARTDKQPVPEEWIRNMHAQYIQLNATVG